MNEWLRERIKSHDFESKREQDRCSTEIGDRERHKKKEGKKKERGMEEGHSLWHFKMIYLFNKAFVYGYCNL